ncbi:hypothetical protein Tco_1334739 [Tanacetum coccineum]
MLFLSKNTAYAIQTLALRHMAPLPAADQGHLWLRYQIEEYTEGIRHGYVLKRRDEARLAVRLRLDIFWRGTAGFLAGLISSDRDFLGPAHSYVLIRDPMRRLCHRMIAYSISGRGQAPKKVTGIDLFYLRSMDRGTINVPHLLAEGRKSEARLLGGALYWASGYAFWAG